MLWAVNGSECPSDSFDMSTLAEILYEFNGPQIFTVMSHGRMQLWYASGDDFESNLRRFLVVPTSNIIIDQLKSGIKSVYEALSQPWVWAVDVNENDKVCQSWALFSFDDVPQMARPHKNVLLWPDLEPLLSCRLIGNGLAEGRVPASVIARAVEQPISALKKLLEMTVGSVSVGRPRESLRMAYDLPAMRFAFNSFEVSFGVPVASDLLGMDWGLYSDGAEKLRTALIWLGAATVQQKIGIELLEVLKDLMPPSHGQVEMVELSGRLIGRESITLTRDDRSAVTSAIRACKADNKLLRDWTGRVREFDKDNLTFILRNADPDSEGLVCSFGEEHYDDVYDAFESDAWIQVVVRQIGTKMKGQLLAIELFDGGAISI
ncbi:hypothetical protein [Derxia lacustris]|uniref:hypothetical protein n=1 Tax=Derxia lacustris TaxID=764842 RepID=UPI00111C0392|nr:hypothetical protein [Derxia lacustris]